MKAKIGVFGSAFNPPTRGHLDVIEQAISIFSTVLLVPSGAHAFGKQLASFNIRVSMLNLFLMDLNLHDKLEVCTIESALLKKGSNRPVYLFDLLEALEKSYDGTKELYFIRGPDNAYPSVWDRFYRAQDIQARWKIFTAKQRVSIRSTQVRQLIKEKTDADDLDLKLKQLVTPSVYNYLINTSLYKEGT